MIKDLLESFNPTYKQKGRIEFIDFLIICAPNINDNYIKDIKQILDIKKQSKDYLLLYLLIFFEKFSFITKTENFVLKNHMQNLN